MTRAFSFLEDVLLDVLVDRKRRIADVLDANAPWHLRDDDLDVLVVDGDAPAGGRPAGSR
jgi:hypothetical protein